MDVRISFRVRERKDVDLILGQGMLAAGWHAHVLNAPGKSLISAAEHDTPKRARAYLMTDQVVASTAATYADFRPLLDSISRRAVVQDAPSGDVYSERDVPESYLSAPVDDAEEPDDAPEIALWAALVVAPPMSSNGVPIQDISDTVGHKSTHVTETVYRHVIVPKIRGGATVMGDVFADDGNYNEDDRDIA
jgi:S-DNA-T family DNA segregation ATPase FtsK/SpoIIIE